MRPLVFAVVVSGALLTTACQSLTEPVKPMLAMSRVAGAPSITMTDLGTLGPGPGICLFPASRAVDINERGLIVGWSDSACTRRAFMWEGGTMTSIGAFDPVAVNNHEQIVGNRVEFSSGDFRSHAVLYQNGALTELGTLGGDVSEVRALNDRGQSVGNSATGTGATHAFLWQDGTMTDLGTLGGPSSDAVALNNRGQVVGHSVTATGATHAFLWQDGTMTDLGTLGGNSTTVFDLNDRGQIVGEGTTAAGQTHPFLWQDGLMSDLGTLGGTASAHAVNERGQIAGVARTATGEPRLLLWQDGVMTDLGTPLAQGFGFIGRLSLNDRGQIVGAIAFSQLRGGRSFLWQDGTLTQLEGIGAPVALNRHGQIAGWVLHGDFESATLWTVERSVQQVAAMAPVLDPM